MFGGIEFSLEKYRLCDRELLRKLNYIKVVVYHVYLKKCFF